MDQEDFNNRQERKLVSGGVKVCLDHCSMPFEWISSAVSGAGDAQEDRFDTPSCRLLCVGVAHRCVFVFTTMNNHDNDDGDAKQDVLD